MAKKNDKGEPVGWVTVKGKHFPKWADGTIGWQDGEEDTGSKKSTSNKSVKRDKKSQHEEIVGDIENYVDYGDITAARGRELKRIDWGNLNFEDADMLIEQYGDSASIKGMKWKDIKSVNYVPDKTMQKYGYEGGYDFTMNDGSKRRFGWKPYPDNNEIHEVKTTGRPATEKDTLKKSSKATDTKSGYTVMMNTKDGFKEAKTFKSAAEADDYITKQVKSGNGISTDWNVKKNGKVGNWENDMQGKVAKKLSGMSGIDKSTVASTSQQVVNGIKAGSIDEKGAKAYGLSKKDFDTLRKSGQPSTSKTSSTKTKDIEKPATTSRNARYDTSRSTESYVAKYGSKSVASLKAMYKNASPQEQMKILAVMKDKGYEWDWKNGVFKKK